MKTLLEPIYCVGIHGQTGQEIDEGKLKPGAKIKDVHFWEEGDFCDPERIAPLPRYAKPETCSFLASTDGGKCWFRQTAFDIPLTEE